MTIFNKTLSQIVNTIKNNHTFFIAGHLKPDGDTIGTGLALASLLKRMGKKPYVYSKDKLPVNLSFLPGIKNIKIKRKVSGNFDCAIILECADFERMGNIIAPSQVREVINIDHHTNFNHFGDINFINDKASSSAEQLFLLFKYLKMKILKDEAINMYAALVTDTGKFQQANTTPEALLMACELVQAGVIPTYMYDNIYAAKTYSSLKLLGLALTTLKVNKTGKIAYMEVTKKMFKTAEAESSETEEIINYAMMVSGVTAGVLFKEDVNRTVKVSFRSRGSVDVNKVARIFAGGGHKKASGCTVKGSIGSVKKKVFKELEKEV